MVRENFVSNSEDGWLAAYKAANDSLLTLAPDFAAWLETEYVPIAGGWQY